MKKRILSLIVVLCVVFSLLTVSASAAGDIPEGLEYIICGDYVAISDYTGSDATLVIPAEIEGLPVTSIWYNAFADCTSLTSITLPTSVTCIENNAFARSGLIEIYIHAGLTEIGYRAFAECPNLTAIHVDPDNPIYYSSEGVLYGDEMYAGEPVNMLLQVPGAYEGVLTIPEGVKCFNDYYTMTGCTGVTEVYIPASLNKMESNHFHDCIALTAIHVDDSNEFFYDIDGIMYGPVTTHDENGNPVDQLGLIACPAAYPGSDFEVPEGVEVIGPSAFQNCRNIENLYIPASTRSIYTQNFYGCDNLTGIWVDEANAHFVSDECGVVYNRECTYEEYVYGDTEEESGWADVVYPEMSILHFFPTGLRGCYEIPEGVVRLAYDSFFFCNVDAIIFPTTLNQIIDCALEGCGNLDWMLFRGDLPHAGYNVMGYVDATIYYPAENETWAEASNGEDVFTGFLSDLTYVGYSEGNAPAPPYDMIAPEVTNPFEDVPEGAYYYDPVMWAVENSVTSGTTATTFAPFEQTERCQVVTFLWRAAGEPEPTSTVNPFTDVKTTDYYYKAVLWAVENRITSGTSDTTFSPTDKCERCQVVTFLWRAAGEPVPTSTNNPFTDVKATDYYRNAVLWAVEKGITSGTTAATFAPHDITERCQAVTFLYRYYAN